MPPYKTICIVHYNTPTLTRATISSIRKQCGDTCRIVIFDNSDVEPFQSCDGITIFDNTRGQIIDFEAELAAYPSRRVSKASCFGRSIFGSVKHSMSVEWLLQNLDTPFILADSDILLKAPIESLWDERVTAAGYIETDSCYGNNRLQPFLCFINAPECRRLGIHYFDPMRTWQLGTGATEKDNWYDTGASFYEDLQRTDGATIRRMDTTDLMVHLGGASYLKTKDIPEWLFRYRNLWNPDYQWSGTKTYISTIAMENVKVITQDGRQFHLTADPGYLLRAKDTGDVVKVANTLRLDRWEVIEDHNAAKPTMKKKKKKKVRRKQKV